MDDMTRFEDRFEERIRAFARTGVQSVDSAAVARAVAVGHPKSGRHAAGAAPAPGRDPSTVDPCPEPHSPRRRSWPCSQWVARCSWWPGIRARRRAQVPAPAFRSSLLQARRRARANRLNRPRPPSRDQAGVWIATGSMGTPRSGHTAVRLLDGRVLVAGGYPGDEPDLAVTSAELYDPESGTWSANREHAQAPRWLPGHVAARRQGPRRGCRRPGCGQPGPRSRGLRPGNRDLERDRSDGQTRQGLAPSLLLDGRVLVVHSFGKSELYDPDSGTWTATGQMLAYFHQAFASVLMPDGKVLVAGGGDGMRYAGDAAELYDPESGTWSAIANMNGRKEVIAATLLRDGTVLVDGQRIPGRDAPRAVRPGHRSLDRRWGGGRLLWISHAAARWQGPGGGRRRLFRGYGLVLQG